MKPGVLGLTLASLLSCTILAQEGSRSGGRGGGPGGGPGMFDPARRTEMMVQRLTDELGLDQNQQKQIKELVDKAQESARPLQEEFQTNRIAIKEAALAGKAESDLEALHQQLGATQAKLAAIQSSAFVAILKTLRTDQKESADTIFETLGTFTSTNSGRGGGGPRRGGMDFASLPKVTLPETKDLAANGLALTPPMGWNSWNRFRTRFDDKTVREIADAMVASGMKDAGYAYVNIDDGWQGERDAGGVLQPNSNFPDMKGLADYIHSKGLKLGIYSSPGPRTCAGYEGSYGHEEQDAKTWAAWGIDYLKYDWCSAGGVFTSLSDMRRVYQKMAEALRATGRPIVYSICQYGREQVWEWGPKAGGNLWRTTGDIGDRWQAMANIGFRQNNLADYAGPGRWNDPDMLEIGNGGMSDIEYRTHFSLWAILAAPLIAGNDLRNMSSETKQILLNREVIAVNQDRLGQQGRRILQDGTKEVWTRPLESGAVAVALFNRGAGKTEMTITWADLKLARPAKVRDLWAHADREGGGDQFTARVPGHGVVLLRVAK